MNFIDTTISKLRPLLFITGIVLSEESKDFVTFTFENILIKIAHDPREHVNHLWIGRKHSDFIEIDDKILKEHFKCNLKLNNLPPEDFVNNVVLFFSGVGRKLLNVNESEIQRLESFFNARNEQYTQRLLNEQNLREANKAWIDKNFFLLVSLIDGIPTEHIPASLQKKYTIAKKRIHD